MIGWIIAWYVIGFVSSVLVRQLDAWTDYWHFDWKVRPFSRLNLIQCLLGGFAGPFATGFLIVGVVFHGGVLLKKLVRNKVDLDRPLFDKKK